MAPTDADLALLNEVDRQAAATAASLGSALSVNTSVVSARLTKLRREGYVTSVHQTDPPTWTLTPMGRTYVF